MSLYQEYLKEIDLRKEDGLHPKPIEDGELLSEIIHQIKDETHQYRGDSINFFTYNVIPGTTSAASVKAKFLKDIILKTFYLEEISPAFALSLIHI